MRTRAVQPQSLLRLQSLSTRLPTPRKIPGRLQPPLVKHHPAPRSRRACLSSDRCLRWCDLPSPLRWYSQLLPWRLPLGLSQNRSPSRRRFPRLRPRRVPLRSVSSSQHQRWGFELRFLPSGASVLGESRYYRDKQVYLVGCFGFPKLAEDDVYGRDDTGLVIVGFCPFCCR